MLKNRTRRWAAIFVLATLAFVQANMALAACAMERGEFAAAGMNMDGCDMPDQQPAMDNSNQCLAHCTSDLQNSAQPVMMVLAIPAAPVLLVAPAPVANTQSRGLTARPPGAPPHRVLLHSFLI